MATRGRKSDPIRSRILRRASSSDYDHTADRMAGSRLLYSQPRVEHWPDPAMNCPHSHTGESERTAAQQRSTRVHRDGAWTPSIVDHDSELNLASHPSAFRHARAPDSFLMICSVRHKHAFHDLAQLLPQTGPSSLLVFEEPRCAVSDKLRRLNPPEHKYGPLSSHRPQISIPVASLSLQQLRLLVSPKSPHPPTRHVPLRHSRL